MRPWEKGHLAAIVVMVVWVSMGSVAAQSVVAPELKAALLLNLARFVEWPADVASPGAPLIFCIANDEAVADLLEQTLKGRRIESHDLLVRHLKDGAPLPTCHVLYVGGANLKRSLAASTTVHGLSVLTVSDAVGFAQAGGIAELFLDNNRMRIAVNVDALPRAPIRLSSRVLELAKIVRDVR